MLNELDLTLSWILTNTCIKNPLEWVEIKVRDAIEEKPLPRLAKFVYICYALKWCAFTVPIVVVCSVNQYGVLESALFLNVLLFFLSKLSIF